MFTETEGDEIGSTFVRISCSGCSQPLGKIYKTTPPALDHWRNKYCLQVDAMKSYQLGSLFVDNYDVSQYQRSLDELFDSHTKMMQFLLGLNEKMNEMTEQNAQLQKELDALKSSKSSSSSESVDSVKKRKL